MIYLTTEEARGAMLGYLESAWSGDLADRIEVLTYEDLEAPRRIPGGAVLFSDMERLTPAQRELAGLLGDALRERRIPRINDPREYLTRPDLLARLHREGINAFRAFVPGGELPAVRFPVFVREAHGHTGSLTRLLHDPKELKWSLRMLTRFGGYRPEQLLVVEFADTREDTEYYAKYSAFLVGGEILPRCIEFDRHWVVKHTGMQMNATLAARELDYMRANPHRDDLRKVFSLARAEYGRIDYGLARGRIQVWEINSNPQPATLPLSWGATPSQELPDFHLRRESKELFFNAYRKALAALEDQLKGPGLQWTPEPALVGRCRQERSAVRRRARRIRAASRLRGLPGIRDVVRRLADRSGGA